MRAHRPRHDLRAEDRRRPRTHRPAGDMDLQPSASSRAMTGATLNFELSCMPNKSAARSRKVRSLAEDVDRGSRFRSEGWGSDVRKTHAARRSTEAVISGAPGDVASLILGLNASKAAHPSASRGDVAVAVPDESLQCYPNGTQAVLMRLTLDTSTGGQRVPCQRPRLALAGSPRRAAAKHVAFLVWDLSRQRILRPASAAPTRRTRARSGDGRT